MRVVLIITLLPFVLGAFNNDACPEFCECQKNEFKCSSYDFIKKLLPKQIKSIVKLHLNDASLVNIDPKLKYLKNLEFLDLNNNNVDLPLKFPYLPKLKSLNLSGNHLKDIELSQLPKNLEILDLSSNFISHFPKDWKDLKQLKTLHLHDNYFECDCDTLLIYNGIITSGIEIPETLTCYYPKEFNGRLLNSLNCSIITDFLLNTMLADEGSGASNLSVFDDNDNVPITNDEDEYITTNNYTQPEIEVEGSGVIPDEEVLPLSCHMNCSTPKPVGADDEQNASPIPSLKEQVGIIIEDIFSPEEETTTTTTTTTITTTSTAPTITENFVTEPEILVKEIPEVYPDNDKQAEIIPTNDTIVGELERASIQETSPYFIFIVLGLVLALVAFLSIYYISKKRVRYSNKRRNKSVENGFGEEMKPLSKPVKPIENDDQKNANPESEPLLYGQNGNNVPAIIADSIQKQPNDVELRKPNQEELLTPQLERVTIKVGELPDSVPKTPLLVHRHINSDGEITTTICK